MCGRTACTYKAEDLKKKCAFKQSLHSTKLVHPEVMKCSRFQPKYNIGPGMMNLCMISSQNVPGKRLASGRTIMPMQFGLVRNLPPSNRIFNARAETIMIKPMFKGLFERGQRCVILCDGFYEWKKVKGQKVPYFFHSPIKDYKGKKNKMTTGKLTYLAGLYEYRKPSSSKAVGNGYYFTILTVPPSNLMKPIHDRMPAVLESEEDVRIWLDAENHKGKKAYDALVSCEELEYYQVSTYVSNINNNSSLCIQPAKPQRTIESMFKVKKEARSHSSSRRRNSQRTSASRSRSISSASRSELQASTRKRKSSRSLSSRSRSAGRFKKSKTSSRSPKRTRPSSRSPRSTIASSRSPRPTGLSSRSPRRTRPSSRSPRRIIASSRSPRPTTLSSRSPSRTRPSSRSPSRTRPSSRSPRRIIASSRSPRPTRPSSRSPRPTRPLSRSPRRIIALSRLPKRASRRSPTRKSSPALKRHRSPTSVIRRRYRSPSPSRKYFRRSPGSRRSRYSSSPARVPSDVKHEKLEPVELVSILRASSLSRSASSTESPSHRVRFSKRSRVRSV